jgi:hypothetical protein
MADKAPPLTFSRPIGVSYKEHAATLEGVARGFEQDQDRVTDAVRSLLLTLCPECRESVEVRLLRRLTGT